MNPILLQGFEWELPADGQHWQHLQEQAPALKEMGIDAIWLPPFCKATSPQDVGYGIYDLYDLGEFDQKGGVATKYGTRQALEAAIQALHEAGIAVYADLVMNHKAAADETEVCQAVAVDPNNRMETIGEPQEIEAWTGFSFPGRQNKYSDFQWHWYHFNGVDYDARSQTPGVYRLLGEGKDWSHQVSGEKGNFDYLMFANIDHRHPEVQKAFEDWLDWLLDNLPLDGFRIDAAKHISARFIEHLVEWFEAKQTEEGQPKHYLFGEYWMGQDSKLMRYRSKTGYGLDLFDVPLHFRFFEASKQGGAYDLRTLFDQTLVSEDPLGCITFVDNHDSQPGQALESWVEPWFKELAYAAILLRKDGYPCLFWGDLFGCGGPHPIPGNLDGLKRLMRLRKTHAYGEQVDCFDRPSCIGWIRRGGLAGPLVVVMTNQADTELTLSLGEEEAGQTYVDALGHVTEPLTLDEQGQGAFKVNGGSVSCWIRKSAGEAS